MGKLEVEIFDLKLGRFSLPPLRSRSFSTELFSRYQRNERALLISLTFNVVERVNGEVKRRESVIRIFPNAASTFRLLGAILMDLNDNWTLRKYMDLSTLRGTSNGRLPPWGQRRKERLFTSA